MLNTFLTKIIGSQNERELKRTQPIVEQVSDLEKKISPLSDEDLRAKTQELLRAHAQAPVLEETSRKSLKASGSNRVRSRSSNSRQGVGS